MQTDEKASGIHSLTWVAENIDCFEFRTPQAMELREKIRRWYYGSQSYFQGMELFKQFQKMFSGNVVLDVLAVPFWKVVGHGIYGEELVEQVEESRFQKDYNPVENTQNQQTGEKIRVRLFLAALQKIPAGHITGKNLYSYIGPGEVSRERLETYFTKIGFEVGNCIPKAGEMLETLCGSKAKTVYDCCFTRRETGVSILGLLTLILGLPALIGLAVQLIQGGGVRALPVSALLGGKLTVGILAMWLICFVLTALALQQYIMTLCGTLSWVFVLQKECKEDQMFLNDLKTVTRNRVEAWWEIMAPEFFENGDVPDSTKMSEPLHDKIREFMLPHIKSSWWKRSWELNPFMERVSKHRLWSWKGIIVLCAVVLAGILLLYMNSIAVLICYNILY